MNDMMAAALLGLWDAGVPVWQVQQEAHSHGSSEAVQLDACVEIPLGVSSSRRISSFCAFFVVAAFPASTTSYPPKHMAQYTRTHVRTQGPESEVRLSEDDIPASMRNVDFSVLEQSVNELN
eukprot:295618-Pelagomonas_calceolata.AAC.3